jgi:hypothetical protein
VHVCTATGESPARVRDEHHGVPTP